MRCFWRPSTQYQPQVDFWQMFCLLNYLFDPFWVLGFGRENQQNTKCFGCAQSSQLVKVAGSM